MAYDPAAGTYVTLVPGSATNPAFTLTGGEGLIVYQIREHQVAAQKRMSAATAMFTSI